MLWRDPKLVLLCVVPPKTGETMNVNNQKEYQLHQIKNLFRFIGYVEKLDDLLELKKSTKFQDSKEFECIIFLCLEYAN